MKNDLKKSYLHRLLEKVQTEDRAKLGKYWIKTQHTEKIKMFVIYKKNKHLATIDIFEVVRIVLNNPDKREKQIIEEYFLNLFPDKIVKTYEL